MKPIFRNASIAARHAAGVFAANFMRPHTFKDIPSEEFLGTTAVPPHFDALGHDE